MYAEVLIQYGIKYLDKTFTYHIPDSLKDDLEVGMKVKIEFGKQTINGFVTNIKDSTDVETKDIIGIVNKDLKLNDELMQLGKYIKDKTLCTLVSAYQTMLPTALKVNKDKEDMSLKVKYIELNKDIDTINEYIEKNKSRDKQIEVLNSLMNGRVLKKDLNISTVKTLLSKDLIKEVIENPYRLEYTGEIENKYNLTPEQTKVYESIEFDKENTYLIHGITGSGKTEIYMHLIDDCLNMNKTAIMLVPEISLTHQIIQRFYKRFGNKVAIFHSRLSEGEKFDEYKKILNKEVSVVIGTRSAIFTPLLNIGIIIIDEEHTSSYKQDNNPRYHALDIAKWRSNYHGCPLVLGSATPSFETMARALKGVYTYLPLNVRVGTSKLPKISIVNMQKEYRKRNMILSDELKDKITDRLNKHEQVMLLLNRRGFSTFISCEECGFTYECPHCDITLTYHKTSNNLRCHYCGYTVPFSNECPNCKKDSIKSLGLGTEKVEEYVKSVYPLASIIRMDIDTTSKKGSHDEIIKAIEEQRVDIVIGTQMISKGLDFPNVTLVGIINADESLNIPDFRSGENTYSLLSQVSGRAGRSALPGEVIIQTFNPDDTTLNFVAKNDYMGNYNHEMNIRKILKYPPYYYLIGIKVTGTNYEILSKEVSKIANYIRNHIDKTTICLGPTTAAIFKVNNVYRFQIIIKYRQDNMLFNTLHEIDEMYISNKNVNFEIDIDPLKI
jgi:primosomal protein N' (replication factor Y)